MQAPSPWTTSFLDLLQSQVLLLVTLRLHSKILLFLECSLCNNWNNHQVLDVNLDIDSSMCVCSKVQTSQISQKTQHTTQQRLLKCSQGFSFYTRSETLNPTHHMGLGWVWNFCRIFWATIFDRSSLIFDRSSLVVLHGKFLQNIWFKLTLKQTLSKSKPRLIVMIMVCQHIQNEVLIYLVPKVLKPNIITLYSFTIYCTCLMWRIQQP